MSILVLIFLLCMWYIRPPQKAHASRVRRARQPQTAAKAHHVMQQLEAPLPDRGVCSFQWRSAIMEPTAVRHPGGQRDEAATRAVRAEAKADGRSVLPREDMRGCEPPGSRGAYAAIACPSFRD